MKHEVEQGIADMLCTSNSCMEASVELLAKSLWHGLTALRLSLWNVSSSSCSVFLLGAGKFWTVTAARAGLVMPCSKNSGRSLQAESHCLEHCKVISDMQDSSACDLGHCMHSCDVSVDRTHQI